jgi:hypothetical protein
MFSSAGDALALAVVLGASGRADRAPSSETTESDEPVAERSPPSNARARRPKALLVELAEEAQHQDPPKPASS